MGDVERKGFGWVGGIFLVKEKVSHLAWLSSSVLLVLTRSARLIFGAPKFEPSIRLIYRSKQPKICPANTVNKQTKISTSFWTNLRLRWPSAPAFCRSTSSLLSWLLQHPLVRHTLGEELRTIDFFSFRISFCDFGCVSRSSASKSTWNSDPRRCLRMVWLWGGYGSMRRWKVWNGELTQLFCCLWIVWCLRIKPNRWKMGD